MNAPTIEQGILEALTLHDKVAKSHLRNTRKLHEESEGIDRSKEALWEIVLWLWAI